MFPLKFFKKVAEEVPAYKKFLKTHKVDPKSIHTLEDFVASVPVTDKKNYIESFDLQDRLMESVPKTIYASSGSSGKPTFWAKGELDLAYSYKPHHFIFHNIWDIPKSRRTLVVICFSQGVWVAGGFTAASIRKLQDDGYMIDLVTPGIERADILSILKTVAPQYQTVVVCGYPPFLMDIFRACKDFKITLPKDVRVLYSGDKITETHRDEFMKFLKTRHAEHILGLYGSADLGAIGFETPYTIAIRRTQTVFHALLAGRIVSEVHQDPALYQYIPEGLYIEQLGNELVFTGGGIEPLLRYKLKDMGGVLDHGEVLSASRQTHLPVSIQKHFSQLPTIFKTGRSDVAVTYYAINLYPENFLKALEDRRITKKTTGSFFTYVKDSTKRTSEVLEIHIEMQAKVRANKALEKNLSQVVSYSLSKTSLEFRKLLSSLGKKVMPKVKLIPHGTPVFKEQTAGLYRAPGKKPRIII